MMQSEDYMTKEQIIDRLCWYAQLNAEQTQMAQSNKKDKKISFYQYSYDEMMKLYDNGEYRAAKNAAIHSLYILCDINFLITKTNRKELKIRYKFDENGYFHLMDPCCDEIPAHLFLDIISALNKVKNEYNKSITNNEEESEVSK